MRASGKVCFLAASAGFLVGCGGSNATLPVSASTPSPIAFASHASAPFTFRYAALDAASVAATGAAVVVAIVHEFAHCASMRVNPAIANNPRWLWETVALYEAGQIVDPRTLPYMTAHRPRPAPT